MKQSTLGRLIGTPIKRKVTVVYKGIRYSATEEDVRYIQTLISSHFANKEFVTNEDVTDLVKRELNIKVIDGDRVMLFRPDGKFLNEFYEGFFDVNNNLLFKIL